MPKSGNQNLKKLNESSQLLFDMDVIDSTTQLGKLKTNQLQKIVLDVQRDFIENKKPTQNEISQLNLQTPELVKELQPVFSKPGYSISPSLIQLCRKTKLQMENVEKLKIWNKFGEIQWIEPVDLTGVNIDTDVQIQQGKVVVYPDDIYFGGEAIKPEVGSKLNGPCFITLNNIPKPANCDLDSFIQRLKKRCEKQDCEFINYQHELQKYTFKVFHYTIYDFNQDSDEEEEQQVENEEQIRSGSDDQQQQRQDRPNLEEQFSYGDKELQINSENLDKNGYNDQTLQQSQIDSFQDANFKNKQINKTFVSEIDQQSNLMNLLNQSAQFSYKNQTEIESMLNQIEKQGQNQLQRLSHNYQQGGSNQSPFDGERIFNQEQEIQNLKQRQFEYKKQLEEDIKMQKEQQSNLESYLSELSNTVQDTQCEKNPESEHLMKYLVRLNHQLQGEKMTKKSDGFSKDKEFPIFWMKNNKLGSLYKQGSVHQFKQNYLDCFLIDSNQSGIDFMKVFTYVNQEFKLCLKRNENKLKKFHNSDQISLEEFKSYFYILLLHQQFQRQNFNYPQLYLELILILFDQYQFQFEECILENSDTFLEELLDFFEQKSYQEEENFEYQNQTKQKELKFKLHQWTSKCSDILKKSSYVSNTKIVHSRIKDFQSDINEENSHLVNQTFVYKTYNKLLETREDFDIQSLFESLKGEKIQNDWDQLLKNSLELKVNLLTTVQQNPEERFLVNSTNHITKIFSEFTTLQFIQYWVIFNNYPNLSENKNFIDQYVENYVHMKDMLFSNMYSELGIWFYKYFANLNILNENEIRDLLIFFFEKNGGKHLIHEIKKFFPQIQVLKIRNDVYLRKKNYHEAIQMHVKFCKYKKAHEIFKKNIILRRILGNQTDYLSLKAQYQEFNLGQYLTQNSQNDFDLLLRDFVFFMAYYQKNKFEKFSKIEFQEKIESVLGRITVLLNRGDSQNIQIVENISNAVILSYVDVLKFDHSQAATEYCGMVLKNKIASGEFKIFYDKKHKKEVLNTIMKTLDQEE